MSTECKIRLKHPRTSSHFFFSSIFSTIECFLHCYIVLSSFYWQHAILCFIIIIGENAPDSTACAYLVLN